MMEVTKRKRTYVAASCLSSALMDRILSDEIGFDKLIIESKEASGVPNVNVGPLEKVIATRRTIVVNQGDKQQFDVVKAEFLKARQEVDIVVFKGDHETYLKRLLEGHDPLLMDAIHVTFKSASMFRPALARIISEKNIAYIIDCVDLLHGETRARFLAYIRHIIRLFIRRVEKATNLIICNGTSLEIELRSIEELRSIGHIMGLREEDIDRSLSVSVDRLIEHSYRRKMAYLSSKDKVATTMRRENQQQSTSSSSVSSKKKKRPNVEQDTNEERRKRAALWNR